MTNEMRDRALLVSDFDGTMTRNDFYKLAVESLVPPDLPPHWQEYRAGRKTHFEALRDIFATIRGDEAAVLEVVSRMEIDPEIAEAVEELDRSGWSVVVASAGCDWYIRRLLSGLKGRVEVHSNPGRFEAGRGLLMELPTASPYFCDQIGVNKAAIVRAAIEAGPDGRVRRGWVPRPRRRDARAAGSAVRPRRPRRLAPRARRGVPPVRAMVRHRPRPGRVGGPGMIGPARPESD